MLQLDRPLVAIDLETTGTDVEKDRIVQLAFVIREPRMGDVVKAWSKLFNPGIPIPAGATEKHGITDAAVKDCPPFRDYAANLARGLTNVDFAGYNVKSFDLRMLDAEMRRAGVAWTSEGARVIDAYRLWTLARPRTLGGAVQEYLGREPRGAHEAMADVLDALDVINAQLAKHPELPRGLDALHTLQWPEDANKIDPDGKFVWVNNEAVISFSKHKGTRLRDLDKGFLQWMLKPGQEFHPRVKQIAKDAIRGVYPVRVVAPPPPDETPHVPTEAEWRDLGRPGYLPTSEVE